MVCCEMLGFESKDVATLKKQNAWGCLSLVSLNVPFSAQEEFQIKILNSCTELSCDGVYFLHRSLRVLYLDLGLEQCG